MSTKDSDLLGEDEEPTFDVSEAKERVSRRRKKLLENPIVDSQPDSEDGNKEEYSVEDEYSMKEGKRTTPKAPKDERESDEQKSPLQ